MFAPKAATSAALRNPRRRQRTSSGESIKPPNAKRQRSILRQDETFETADLTERDPYYRSLEHPTPTGTNDSNPGVTNDDDVQKSIPIRTTKKHEKRKGDTINPIILSKTDFYTVSQLPSLPDQIRNLQPGPSRCYFASCQGYGLVITQSEAIIWPYSVLSSSPSPADIFRLPIPETYRTNCDLAPLGVILSTATSSIPGLMILMPQNGKIIYWETVSCAASLGLPRQKQTGLHGFIPGMLSGEYATEIVNGEPSGIMVTFSSGRVAHITLRDSQGKPAVTVNFLKNSPNNGGIGFFGGIKNVLGGGFWRKKVAAVRAGESCQRGQRDIIIATSAGLVEIWDTHWNNGSILKRQFDIKDDLRKSLAVHSLDLDDNCEVRVWDLAFATHKQNLADPQGDNGQSWQVAVLVGLFSGSNPRGVFVVQLNLSENICILSTNPISSHTLPTDIDDLQPRLFIPAPSETAFIVLGQSVILLSLVGVGASPSSQLLIDNGQPQSFHDSINFRCGKEYEILGAGFEDESDGVSYPACLVMIRDFGVIRISALPRQETASNTENAQITAQHKIEQAVFYGTLLGNPLNLSSKGHLDFPIMEIEDATLEICRGLLQSSSKFIPTTAISVDQNLKLRAKALDDLCRLLLEQNKILDRRIWWELLWGAEKIAAQRAIWKLEESARKSKTSGPTFLAHVLGSMSDKFKTKPEHQGDASDMVRHWFLYDTYRMEHIVPWIYHAIKPQKGNASKQLRRMSEHILEASELSLAVLETAFKYRDEHASRFGIGDGYLEEGVLITGYEGLPEFWTSYSISYSETGHLLEVELESCRAWIQTSAGAEKSDQQLIGKIARNSARHLRILGQMYSERTRWLSAQEDQKLVDEAISIKESHTKQRRWHLFKLAGIGQLDDAINIAESFRDMTALVELIIELQDQSKSVMFAQDVSEDSSSGSQTASTELEMKITQYFEKFGDAWADAFFARQISMGQSGILFSMAKFQPFVTRFLHKNPAYSKLSWINDVVGDADYEVAAKTLENLALEQEQDIWSHRVELSLAKLANLATLEKQATSESQPLQANVKRLEDLAEMGAVQEVIYAHISPVLQGAIDQKAEIDLAIDHFANSIAQDRPSLHELLGEALTGVVSRRVLGLDQIVDLLTLMDLGQDSDASQNDLFGREFYLALRVVRLGLYSKGDPNYSLALQKLIWRRCIIEDNWDATGKAVEQMGSKSETLLYTTSLFRTLVLCLKDRHAEDYNTPPVYLPTSPEEVLLNDSDSALLSSRFRPEQRARFIQDLEHENSVLNRYMEIGQLGFWFKNLVSSAEKVITHSIDTEAPLQPVSDAEVKEDLPNQTESSFRKERLSWL
ncbi:Non-repetitive/WGA-negative nucleoporin C-terminal-domain-containing protein [Aspergillus granulosus]|uniref:Non-repetitive/WGA-negative nucleoporin C-terminal-domain-containing protein n=1 Tax=Aspergillus granulosus TaxID=176169 RepID=A0ABR4HL12_9EURO